MLAKCKHQAVKLTGQEHKSRWRGRMFATVVVKIACQQRLLRSQKMLSMCSSLQHQLGKLNMQPRECRQLWVLYETFTCQQSVANKTSYDNITEHVETEETYSRNDKPSFFLLVIQTYTLIL